MSGICTLEYANIIFILGIYETSADSKKIVCYLNEKFTINISQGLENAFRKEHIFIYGRAYKKKEQKKR